MEIQFGSLVLEVPNIERADVEDLFHSRAGLLTNEILRASKDAILLDMREAIKSGELNKANQLEGYIQCLEDLVALFDHNLSESLKPQE